MCAPGACHHDVNPKPPPPRFLKVPRAAASAGCLGWLALARPWSYVTHRDRSMKLFECLVKERADYDNLWQLRYLRYAAEAATHNFWGTCLRLCALWTMICGADRLCYAQASKTYSSQIQSAYFEVLSGSFNTFHLAMKLPWKIYIGTEGGTRGTGISRQWTICCARWQCCAIMLIFHEERCLCHIYFGMFVERTCDGNLWQNNLMCNVFVF